jgi:hypothetical protein
MMDKEGNRQANTKTLDVEPITVCVSRRFRSAIHREPFEPSLHVDEIELPESKFTTLSSYQIIGVGGSPLPWYTSEATILVPLV